ncbi:DNA polymerase I [compost metagenome]
MTMSSIIRINNKLKELNLKSVLAITVHDSIVADVYVPEFTQVYEIMKYEMENLPFDWVTVPIVAEAEIGRDYGTLVGIDSLDDLNEYADVFAYIDSKVEEKHLKLVEKANKKKSA